MNHVDIILAIPLAYGAFKGFTNGFILELASLVGLLAGVFLASIFSNTAALMVEGMLAWNPMLIKILVFVLIFILVVILVKAFAKFIEKMFKMAGLNFFNRIAGVVGGIFKYAFILSVLLVIFNHFNRSEILMSKETQEDSYLFDIVSDFAPYVMPDTDLFIVKAATQYQQAN